MLSYLHLKQAFLLPAAFPSETAAPCGKAKARFIGEELILPGELDFRCSSGAERPHLLLGSCSVCFRRDFRHSPVLWQAFGLPTAKRMYFVVPIFFLCLLSPGSPHLPNAGFKPPNIFSCRSQRPTSNLYRIGFLTTKHSSFTHPSTALEASGDTRCLGQETSRNESVDCACFWRFPLYPS
ncbi:hypothetical protein BX600DRAFT_256686 [Xylariales sp. PMI_506]|nr:hypothetical protein BX600DRAFT_256686 [Xylariales sp. PMI_506]